MLNLHAPDQSHIQEAYRIFCQHRIEPWSISLFSSSLLKPFCKVCCKQKKILGLVIINQIADDAELEDICVDKDYRRQGIGQALLLEAIEQLKQEKIRALHLEVAQSNKSAIEFYKKLGFTLTGRRQAYYKNDKGNKEDALHYALHLQNYD